MLAGRRLHAAPKLSGLAVANSRRVDGHLLVAPARSHLHILIFFVGPLFRPQINRAMPDVVLGFRVKKDVVRNVAVGLPRIVFRIALFARYPVAEVVTFPDESPTI